MNKPQMPLSKLLPIKFDDFHLYAQISWLCQNGQRPNAYVDTAMEGVSLPPAMMAKPVGIVNIGFNAVKHLDISGGIVSGEARFSGQVFRFRFPIMAILGIAVDDSGYVMPVLLTKYEDEEENLLPPEPRAPHELTTPAEIQEAIDQSNNKVVSIFDRRKK